MHSEERQPRTHQIATLIALLFGISLVVAAEIGVRSLLDLRAPELVVELAQFREKNLRSINPTYARRFFSGVDVAGMRMTPRPFVEPRPENSIRVIVVGGSTVQGYPHPRRLTASSYIQRMLEDAFPQRQVEVFNMGITAISSFGVARVVEDAMDLKPDAIVVYTGHNEIYGVYGAASLSQGGAAVWAKKLHYGIMQWGITALVRRALQPLSSSSGEASPTSLLSVMSAAGRVMPDDARRRDAEENLRTNLRDMAETSRELGTPILLCTVSSNERGFAPSYAEPSIDRDSLKTWKKLVAEGIVAYEDNQYDAARSLFERALTLDKNNAWSHFFLGRCLEMLGEDKMARSAYVKARDMDPTPWRATSGLNDVIRETARIENLPLVDSEGLFRENSPSAGIGWELMDDHVHPSAKGQILLARGVTEILAGMLGHVGEDIERSDAEYRQMQGATALDQLAASHDMHVLLSEEPMSEGNEIQAEHLAMRADSLWNSLVIGEQRGYQRWRQGKGSDLLPLNAADQLFAQGDLMRASIYYRAAALEEPFTPWGDIWATLRWGRIRQLAGDFGAEERATVEAMNQRLAFLANSTEFSPGLVDFFSGYALFLLEDEGVDLLERAIKDRQVRRLFFFDLLAILSKKLPEIGRRADAERYVREVTEELGQGNYGRFLLEQMARSR